MDRVYAVKDFKYRRLDFACRKPVHLLDESVDIGK